MKIQNAYKDKFKMALLWRSFACLCIVFTILISPPASSPAHACTNPAGVEGEIIMNSSFNVPAFCDGTNWNAMVGGDPAISGDYIPNAVEFDGTNDWLTENPITSYSDTDRVTGSFWIRNGSNLGTEEIVFFMLPGDLISIQYIANDNLRFQVEDGVNGQIIIQEQVSGIRDGEWHHVIFSFDSSDGNLHVYVDDIIGTPTSNIVSSLPLSTATAVIVGSRDIVANRLLSGSIADMWIDFDTYIDLSIEANRRKFISANGNPVNLGINGIAPTGSSPDIFLSGDTAAWHTNKGTGGGFTENGALTDAATTPYVPRTKIAPSGLLGHWRLDETSGTTAYDSSGNGSEGTIESIDTATNNIEGKIGRALQFSGNGDRINVPTIDVTSDEISISSWVYLNSITEDGRIMSKTSGVSGATHDWALYVEDSEEAYPVFSYRLTTTPGGYNEHNFTEYEVPLNEWIYVALTYNGANTSSETTLYVNGEFVANHDHDGGDIVTSAKDIGIGNNPSGITNRNLDGALDDVRLYDRALTPEEIAEIYAAKDGIRYNESQRVPEYFDGNRFVALAPNWAAPDKNTPIYSPTLVTGCPNIGDSCSDGSLYAGDAPDTGVRFFITDVNQGTNIQWNTANGNDDIAVAEDDNGALNHAGLNVAFTVLPAINTCETLSLHGHTDWYLPAPNELLEIYANRAAINANATDAFSNSGGFWGSREVANNTANRIDGSGNIQINQKIQDYGVRCVRREPLTITGTGSLVGHWKLDETSGTVAADSSGNGNNGTLSNYDGTEDNYWQTNAPTGIGLGFSGSTVRQESVIIPNSADLELNGSFTYAAWIMRTENIGLDRVLGKYNNRQPNLQINTNGRLTLAYFSSGGSSESTGSINGLGEWTHIIVSYNDSTNIVDFYIDGALDSSQSFTPLTDSNVNDDFKIGAGANFNWGGAIDDVRIYNRPLNATEATQLYQMGAPVGSSTALPQGCPNIGDVCDDGTYYAGDSPDGTIPMFAAPEDANGPNVPLAWNNDAGNHTTTTATSNVTGEANTNTIVATDADSTGGFEEHEAAQYCYDLVTAGTDDWYLPADNELLLLYNGGNQIANVDVGAQYWTSREFSITLARAINMSDASVANRNKSVNNAVRCVRKGPAPRCANPYGLEGQMIYNTDHDVVQYCDGARWVASGKYAP